MNRGRWPSAIHAMAARMNRDGSERVLSSGFCLCTSRSKRAIMMSRCPRWAPQSFGASAGMRNYINEPTKWLKIKDFRFWHGETKPPRASRAVVPSAARRTSGGTRSNAETQKQTHCDDCDRSAKMTKRSQIVPGNAGLLRRGGVPPPAGEDARRLSSGRHAGRKIKSDQRAGHLLSQKRAREGSSGGAPASAKTNPPRSHEFAHGNYQTKPNKPAKSRAFIKLRGSNDGNSEVLRTKRNASARGRTRGGR